MSESMMGMTATACIKYLENWKNAIIERGDSECSEAVMCLTNAIVAMKSQDGLFSMIDSVRKQRDAAVADLKEIGYCCNCCQCTERDGNDIWCVAFGDWFEWYDTRDKWEWRGVTDG